MDNKITLYGASGHGKVIIDILRSAGVQELTVVDDNPGVGEILGIPVITGSCFDFSKAGSMIISIGNNRVRKNISEKCPADFVTAMHPSAVISQFVSIGPGTVIMAAAAVNPGASIGKHCIINTGAVIEHDADIADFVHISPSASLAGNVCIGEGSHIGIGAVVIQGIRIGKWATIGAGAIIIRDVPDFAVVVGNPARIIKYNKDESK